MAWRRNAEIVQRLQSVTGCVSGAGADMQAGKVREDYAHACADAIQELGPAIENTIPPQCAGRPGNGHDQPLRAMECEHRVSQVVREGVQARRLQERLPEVWYLHGEAVGIRLRDGIARVRSCGRGCRARARAGRGHGV
jgi:hypothetical protein